MAVDDRHPLYADMAEEWQIMRDLVKGESAVKSKGETYLPRTPGMRSDSTRADPRYKDYKTRADLPDIVEPAISAAVGAITRKVSTFVRPESWLAFENCATPMAEDIWGFHAYISRELSTIGRAGFAVNVRKDRETGQTVPVFIPYNGEQIINWVYELIEGKLILTFLAIEMMLDLKNPKGEIEETRVVEHYIRDPERGVFLQRFKLVKDEQQGVPEEEKWEEIPAIQPLTAQADFGAEAVTGEDGTGFRLRDIPFVVFNSQRISAKPGSIPFLGLARNTLSRYRMTAGYYEALSFYEPTPYVTGMTEDWIIKGYAPERFGAGYVWHLPQNAQAGMLEYTGPAIANTRLAIRDLEQQALQLALLPYEPRVSTAESGEAKRERRQGQTSLIQDLSNTAGRAVNIGLDIAAHWLGVPTGEKVLWFNVDTALIDYRLDAQELMALVAMWQATAISKRTLHENLQKSGITRLTFEEEDVHIEIDGVPEEDSTQMLSLSVKPKAKSKAGNEDDEGESA